MGKKRPREKTLVHMLIALTGATLTVELRNETSITGVLEHCDAALK